MPIMARGLDEPHGRDVQVKVHQTSDKDFRRRDLARKGAANHGIGRDIILVFLYVDLESDGSSFGEPSGVPRCFFPRGFSLSTNRKCALLSVVHTFIS